MSPKILNGPLHFMSYLESTNFQLILTYKCQALAPLRRLKSDNKIQNLEATLLYIKVTITGKNFEVTFGIFSVLVTQINVLESYLDVYLFQN